MHTEVLRLKNRLRFAPFDQAFARMNRHPREARHEACSGSCDFFLNALTSENKLDEKRQDQKPQEERRKSQEHYKGDERRTQGFSG